MMRKEVETCPDFAEIIKNTTVDDSLFAQITACFSSRLEGFARYVCKDPTRAEDAFQDAMIAAMRHLSTYRGDSPIEHWLKRIIVNACARQKRGLKNSPEMNQSLDFITFDQITMETPKDQELSFLLKERLEMVLEEIQALSEPNRTLLEAHDLKEVSIDEMTRRFAMTEDSIKSRLKRSRAEVKERLLKRMVQNDRG